MAACASISRSGWPRRSSKARPSTESKLRALIGKGERHIRLRQTLPVHLTYFTLTIDEHGQVRSFDDLYGIHRKVRAALGYAG